MNRIKKMFDKLKAKNEKALITYITVGDPDIYVTEKIIRSLIESGADMLELGVPFSDPMADGPTIQAASQRALINPFSIEAILLLVKKIRQYSSIPVILFGYYNPFLQYGLNRLCNDAKAAGVDGFLTVDLPPEEAESFKKEADFFGLDTVFLLAPTSTNERMDIVSTIGTGFIYYVSVTGVTGARKSLSEMMDKYVAKIRKHSSLPVGIGFGISTPEQVREVCSYADAVIVGSAIIKQIEANMNKPDMYEKVSVFVRALKDATRS